MLWLIPYDHRSSANIRAIEKRILDSIIGDGRYDSRIRPSGVNDTKMGGGVGEW